MCWASKCVHLNADFNENFSTCTFFCYNKQVVIRPHTDFGEVAERFKAQSWKDCIRETVSRVRISPSPFEFKKHPKGCFFYKERVENGVA